MDKSFRNDMLATIHPEAQKMTTLASIDREYTLQEIAILTRAGAAKLVGLDDRGSLAEGAWADITVYTENADREKMFEKPDYITDFEIAYFHSHKALEILLQIFLDRIIPIRTHNMRSTPFGM
jgi:formylmethanofuran dehydrogenase subunit A